MPPTPNPKQPPQRETDSRSEQHESYIGTVSAAKRWLKTMACNADATLILPERLPPAQNGIVVITALLRRADGCQVTIQISCFDDETSRSDSTGDFPPAVPPTAPLFGLN